MALVAYDDSESEDNEENENYNRPALVSKKTEGKQTIKIGLPFNNLVSLSTVLINRSIPSTSWYSKPLLLLLL